MGMDKSETGFITVTLKITANDEVTLFYVIQTHTGLLL